MDTILHKQLSPDEVHPPHSWVHFNEAARLAQVVTSNDLGKISWQLTDNTFWVLIRVNPFVEWRQLGSGGEASITDLLGRTINVYVRPNGNDNNDGSTPGNAFATLKKALRSVPLDFFNGRIDIDITGCEICEGQLTIPAFRGPGPLRAEDTPTGIRPYPWADCIGAVNIKSDLIQVLDISDVYPASWGERWPDAERTISYPDVSWVPGQYRGHFLVSASDPSVFAVIIDNTTDTFRVRGDIITDGIVKKPGAKILGDAGSDPDSLLFGSDDGFLVFSGTSCPIVVTGTIIGWREWGRDITFSVRGSSNLLFQGCWMGSNQETGWGRWRPGDGTVFFSKCALFDEARYTGGNIFFTKSVVYNIGAASMHGGAGLLTGAPGMITAKESYIGYIGLAGHQEYPLSFMFETCGIDGMGSESKRTLLKYCYIEGYLTFSDRSDAALEYCGVNGISVVSGSRVRLSGIDISRNPTLVVGDASYDLSTFTTPGAGFRIVDSDRYSGQGCVVSGYYI